MIRSLLLPVLAVLVFVFSAVAQSAITGKVVGVHDGDTVTVLDAGKRQWKIRLAGIDAPELGQAFGQQAKRELSALVYGKRVRIESSKADRYGRHVGKVFVVLPEARTLDPQDANLMMVRLGLAWHYKAYESEQSPEDRRVYAEVERSARRERIGLWSQTSPTPPWEFRRGDTPAANSASGPIIGNRNSHIYHLPGCKTYSSVSEKNRVYFRMRAEAEAAGYRLARNCN